MAKISRGRLSTPIGILRATATEDDYGDTISSFGEVSQTFCEWLPLSANAVIQAHTEGMTISAKLHVDLNTDINQTDKIKNLADNQVYEVITVMPVPADNKKIIICKVSNV
ncbi:possible phage head-tail adaptor protein [Psychrobacter arcticus 273-4]|uniref:Possible phage head-tail adaptor protein n=1 Tax=Psychrobacter arcticus (strain DSM 17307 / VKM B-2377 / 273-4) TaxID=259536 RepID=Q4FUI6_PSYA2|nr:head-tail adaptor protein [Psychrobacter arcticus]AAZ18322.1 possible phage head-tail adaptor protein [Psychrobacter arcticus 273-4]